VRDFFEHQEQARRRSGLLVALFILAVVGLWAALHGAAWLHFQWVAWKVHEEAPGVLDADLLLSTLAFVVAVVGGGSAWLAFALRDGGRAVAERMGALPVDRMTRDLRERRLLNVVEEMALASGSAAPMVYVLHGEDGVNAFAAGWGPEDAVITVTQGALEQLGREELQGVVAHEFSHIVHGDMRLNLRLMAVLHGILLIAMLGRFVLRSGTRGRGKGEGAAVFLAIGLTLYCVGYIGWFLGQLIKSAVCRQREFLADASAVQYTRNPQGLSRALQRVALGHAATWLRARHTDEVGHLLFGEGARASFFGLLATHPPFTERVRRLEPGWDGALPEPEAADLLLQEADRHRGVLLGFASGAGRALREPRTGSDHGALDEIGPGGDWPQGVRLDARHMVERVGTTDGRWLVPGQAQGRLPDVLLAAVEEPLGATGVVLAALLDSNPAVRAAQDRVLGEGIGAPLRSVVAFLGPHLDAVEAGWRLPLVDLAMPALRELSPAMQDELARLVRGLAAADGRVDLFEWALHKVVDARLRALRGAGPRLRGGRSRLAELQRDALLLVALVAHAGHRDPARAGDALRAGAHVLGVQPIATRGIDLPSCDGALDRLRAASPPIRKQVVAALSAAVAWDGAVQVREAELLRAVCAALDCPVPPLPAAA
jgi:Zn-dependent protease with chaperone function